mmetsp:Transcript_5404/g.7541  ORF Transcript_5404/g.7541 Transcript_5404/m.7541 type:complete len:111 (+) Transcript_5404:487-819(+)
MIRTEHERRSWRQVKAVNEKLTAGAIREVELPDEHGGWKKVTDRQEMERGAWRKISVVLPNQANDTPFMQPPLAARGSLPNWDHRSSTGHSERGIRSVRGGGSLHGTAYW